MFVRSIIPYWLVNKINNIQPVSIAFIFLVWIVSGVCLVRPGFTDPIGMTARTSSTFILFGDDGEKTPVNPPRTLSAYPVTGTISTDGRLDEPEWESASHATGFVQYEPNEGAEPSQQTEVHVLYGDNALYVGAILYDDEPDRIMRTMGRRDEMSQSDWFIISIDSYFDRKTAYNFGVNAAGVQADGIVTTGFFRFQGFPFDTSWDAVWTSAVHVSNKGWVVEMRIPYSMLRFPEADIQQWGINFRRMIPRSGEILDWVLIPRASRGAGTVAQYGILDGLQNIRPRRNVQVIPYTRSQVMTEEGDPGKLRSERDLAVGGDLKIGLSTNVTLDATINPDFGQVEADPAELNLTAFETFFPERRPFFTEGIQIFNFRLDFRDALLYTRRIGAHAPIIGASKLSGRTSRGLSFGILGAATGESLDPSRYYGVARLQQQIGNLSSIGGMLTAFEDVGNRRSFTGGIDWDLRLLDNQYRIDGVASFSRRNALTSIPDENGFTVFAGFGKTQGIWNYSTGVMVMSDAYNPNDIGQLRRNNYINFDGRVEHQINGGRPFGPFRRASFDLFASNDISYREQLNQGLGFNLHSDWQTHGFQEIRLEGRSDYIFGGFDIYETRGLSPRSKPQEATLEVSVESDSRRTWQIQPGIEYGWFGDGGFEVGFGIETDWNVSSRLRLSVETQYSREKGVTDWASNEAFENVGSEWSIGEESGEPTSETIFRSFDDRGHLDTILGSMDPYSAPGRYYAPVYGERGTHSLDTTIRGNFILSPILSIQFYGQIFTARGQYQNFTILQDRDTLVELPSYPKTHDFAFTSFQTNTVLRWEYRPGSTLYLVWTQSRWGRANIDMFDLTGRSPYDQRLTDQISDTFDPFPTNVFLIKISYNFMR